jgi:hypothetical protein
LEINDFINNKIFRAVAKTSCCQWFAMHSFELIELIKM